MYFIIYVPLMILALLIGYSTGSYNTVNGYHASKVSDIEDLKKDRQKREELFKAMAGSISARNPASSAIMVKSMLSGRDQDLVALLDSSDSLQVFLGEMLLKGRHGEDDKNANAELRMKLKANPAQGFKALKTAFQSLPFDKYPVEKAALMALTNETQVGKPEEMREMAMESLMKDIPPARLNPKNAITEQEKDVAYSTNEKMFLPAISYEAYLKNSTNADEVMAETLKVLEAQQDHAVRNNIVNTFNQKYPEYDKQLQTAVIEKKIDVLLYQQREQEATYALKEAQLKKDYEGSK